MDLNAAHLFYLALQPFDERGLPIELLELEARYYRLVTAMTNGHIGEAARMAGVNRKTVARHLVKLREARGAA